MVEKPVAKNQAESALSVKHSSPKAVRDRLFPIRLGLFSLCLLCLTAGHATEADPKLEIEVRAKVERPFKGLGKAPLREHGKIYQIAGITLVPSNSALVRPVNERLLLEALQEELAKRGFVEASAEAAPEVILTVIYGRGWLRNPYFDDVMIAESTSPPTVISHGMPTNLARQRSFRHESKLQAAQAEKLFIYVSAWANPADTPATNKRGKRTKPKRLWTTNIIIDDPADRDLNVFIREMLAAGSAYFDRQIDAEEVVIRTKMPEGRVIMAPLHFAEEEAAGGKSPAGK
ncbi:MAG TPA: hypothetical protein PLF88_02140 [Opitutaceae bacterium]|nr:hypothetical protein [Opitutaceae bacterium]